MHDGVNQYLALIKRVRAMFDLIRCDFPHLANLRLTDPLHMTDLKVTLTLWRLQIEQANQALQYFSPRSLMSSVYGERLIENPLETLRSANQFLDLGIPAEQIEVIARWDSRFDDAKNIGQRFSVEGRQESYRKVESFYGAELDNGLRWMVQSNPGTRVNPEMSGSLA